MESFTDFKFANSLRLNSYQAERFGLELDVHVMEGVPPVCVDASKIEQVVTNLVSNAIEHSKRGSTVTVRLESDGKKLSFSVEDHGCGIAPENLERIFNPYCRMPSTKTRGASSTGLGMVIARKIIESHGGEISLESELGKGTTAHFTVPLAQE